MSAYEVRDQFQCMCSLQRSWGQRLGYKIRGQDAIKGHTCCKIDLWTHTYLLWTHNMTSHLRINFNLFWFVTIWRNSFFCLAHKNSHRIIMDCYTKLVFQLVGDKTLDYLIRRDNWPNTSYILIHSHFSNCVLLFDTPCIWINGFTGHRSPSKYLRYTKLFCNWIYVLIKTIWGMLHWNWKNLTFWPRTKFEMTPDL